LWLVTTAMSDKKKGFDIVIRIRVIERTYINMITIIMVKQGLTALPGAIGNMDSCLLVKVEAYPLTLVSSHGNPKSWL
jgi:hypothetical protein